MAELTRLGVQDALWLEMDRPNNLMVVDSVVWTAEPLDFDKVRAVVTERLIERYPVFRSRAVKDDDGVWCWEPFADFDFDDHVRIVNLKKPSDPRSLQAVVAAHRTEMLDRNLPLWQAIWIRRYRKGSAMILRTHHAIADGMRMVQLAMSLFDASPQGGPILGPGVTQHAAEHRVATGDLPPHQRAGIIFLHDKFQNRGRLWRVLDNSSQRQCNGLIAGHVLVTPRRHADEVIVPSCQSFTLQFFQSQRCAFGDKARTTEHFV